MENLDMDLLNARERRVLKWRLGLIDGTPRSPHEVARLFRTSARHISTIETGARWKLDNA